MKGAGIANELATAAGKYAPIPATIWLGTVSTWGPQNWAYVFAAIYAVLQIVHLAWVWGNERADRARKQVVVVAGAVSGAHNG